MGKAKDVIDTANVDLPAVSRCVLNCFIDYGRLNSPRHAANLSCLEIAVRIQPIAKKQLKRVMIVYVRRHPQNRGTFTIFLFWLYRTISDAYYTPFTFTEFPDPLFTPFSGNLEKETQSDDPTRAFKRRMRAAAHSAPAAPPVTPTEARNTKLASPRNKPSTRTSSQLSPKNPLHARPLHNKPAAGSSSLVDRFHRQSAFLCQIAFTQEYSYSLILWVLLNQIIAFLLWLSLRSKHCDLCPSPCQRV